MIYTCWVFRSEAEFGKTGSQGEFLVGRGFFFYLPILLCLLWAVRIYGDVGTKPPSGEGPPRQRDNGEIEKPGAWLRAWEG